MSYNVELNKWIYDYDRPFNPGFIHSADRRKHQRRMNQLMRRMNKNIENDTLWRGRFKVISGKTEFFCYEDKSGYELVCEVIFVDKKTGHTARHYDSVNSWSFWNGGQLWRKMNEFITEDCKVWSEKPGPRQDTIDYRKM